LALLRKRIIRLPAGVAVAEFTEFKLRLEECFGSAVNLRLNDNTSTLLAMRNGRNGSPVSFSVHRMFLSADEKVIGALAQYLRRPTPNSQSILRKYMNQRCDEIRAREPAKSLQLSSRGRVYDLHRMADEVNREYFNGELNVYISWSRGKVLVRRRRHILFGSYCQKSRLVRIHPALDDENVPEYFVKFVIFHEMLHARLEPFRDADGRRCIHSREFRRLERHHPDYARAMAFERKFMGKD
jgi:hypothetical protein